MKTVSFNTLLIGFLVTVIAALLYMNYQQVQQNNLLATQLSELSDKLSVIDQSADNIEQRMTKIEDQMSPKFQGLVAGNYR